MENNLIATRYCLDNESVNYYQREEDLKHNDFQLTITNNTNIVEGNIDYWVEKFQNQSLQIERLPSIQEAVERLCEELKNDEDYYRSWKDNIAMAFKDAYYNDFIKPFQNGNYKVKEHESVHIVANKAADNFLKQLIK